jgi:hypothetical protein
MCRNIKLLYNFDPPATKDEIQAASLQFVRKVSGMNKPAEVNTQVFDLAVEEVAQATQKLMNSLTTAVPHKNREEEAAKAKARNAKKFENNP